MLFCMNFRAIPVVLFLKQILLGETSFVLSKTK